MTMVVQLGAVGAVKLAFWDTMIVDYTADTPWQRPLGGSQSAICYLAIALTQQGHEVAVINNTSTPGRYRGIYFPESSIGRDATFLRQQDAIVATGLIGSPLRRAFPRRPGSPLLICWLQHAADQPAVESLCIRDECEAWDGFAFVSRWQAQSYQSKFPVDPRRIRIMRNAIAPFFAEQPWEWRPVPQDNPTLVYTSTPFRGLDLLLDAFPRVRREIPGLRLRLFSSMKGYGLSDERYMPLFERARSIPGVECLGSVDQPRLAREMAGADMLAYPSTFAETACIAVMEAMASGCLVATTDLGALPETLGGFGGMMPSVNDQNRAGAAEAFAELALGMLRQAIADPTGHAARTSQQVRFARTAYSWPRIAKQWADWISTARARAGSAASGRRPAKPPPIGRR
jgi:glycosyltransferase involved in cell wall biosynthesis